MAPTDPPQGPTPAGRPSAEANRWIIAIVFVGLVVRVLFSLFTDSRSDSDPDAYIALAENILDQGGLYKPGTSQPTAFRPPLFPWLLSVLLWTGLTPRMAAVLINLAFSAAILIATWWISRVVGLRQKWLLLPAVLCALDPLLIHYSSLPMTEIVTCGLLTAAMLNSIKAVTVDDTNDQRRLFLTAGVFWGLAGLCRPIAFVACAVVGLRILWQCRPVSGVGVRSSSFLNAMLLPIAAGVLLLPWVIRNFVQFRAFIPATTHGGYTLLLGNNDVFYREVVQVPGQPRWQGPGFEAWQTGLNDRMRHEGVSLRNEVETDRWMYAEARRCIAESPAAFASACWLRLRRFWAVRPSADSPGWKSFLSMLWYGFVLLALISSLFCRIRDRCDIQILWLAILSFLLIHTFYWTNTRMRAPLTGVIAVLSTVGLQHVMTFVTGKTMAARNSDSTFSECDGSS